MRKLALALAAAVLCACRVPVYDPIDELEYRVYADGAAAVRAIIAEVEAPRVYAIGEYHMTRGREVARSSMAQFTDQILDVIAPRAQQLLVETWVDPCAAGPDPDPVAAQVAAKINRPVSMQAELMRLETAAARRLTTNMLSVTCIEQSAMLDPRGRVDFYRLLVMITEKLRETARALAGGGGVIVYGGAVHNDLFPRYQLEELTYAERLSRELGGGVLEIDLAVPEVVAPLAIARREPWYPLLALAAPDRAILWQRGPASYVVLLPGRRP